MKGSFFILIALLVGCGRPLSMPTENDLRQIEANSAVCDDGFSFSAKEGACVDSVNALVGVPLYMEQICENQMLDQEMEVAACRSDKQIDRAFLSSIRHDGLCLPGSRFDVQRKVCADESFAYGPFSEEILDRCVGTENCDGRQIKLENIKAVKEDFFCPSGWSLDRDSNQCVQDQWVMGPFSEEMVNACVELTEDSSCHGDIWGLSVYLELRGDQRCPQGTDFDDILGFCRSDRHIFGPFSPEQVENCIESGGEKQCLSNRWDLSLVRELGF